MDKKTNKQSPEVIFLIGAGISVPLDIPAMHGIFKAFMNKGKSGITDNEKRICQIFIKELGVPDDLEEFLLATNTIIEFKDSSLIKLIEKSISPRKSSSRVLDYQEKLNKSIKNVRAVQRKILKFMARTCFRFNRSKALNILYGFVEAVASKGYPIYTTNYDFAFEYVAEEKGIIIQDNFVKKHQRYIWNHDIDFPTGNVLTIIKLHGSVTWYVDNTGVIEKIYSDTDINPVGHDIDRLVIFPTRFKDIYEQNFFALYSHFLTALSTASCLVVIGHSLRDDYLKAGIIERYRKGKFQVIFIDPDFPLGLPSEMNPTPRDQSRRTTHVPYRFEAFSDDLADIIMNTPPLDIAQKCANIAHHIKSKTDKIKIRGNIGSLRVGQKKHFKAAIDARIPRDKKPAYVRVWLGANYRLPTGEEKKEISPNFIDEWKTQVATKLSGMVKTEVDIAIEVPEYPEWLKHTNKVTLYVGLLTTSSRKPTQLSPNNILAEDRRELVYTK